MVELRVRRGVELVSLEATLRDQANEANNVVVSFAGHHPKDYLTQYLDWVNQAWRMLEGYILGRNLEELLYTKSYWILRQMDGNEAWLTGQIKRELNARREELLQLADEAKVLKKRWDLGYGVIVVPDTNVLLHSTKFFDELDWPKALQMPGPVYIVLLMAVIDQVDNLKRSKQPIRGKARQTARKIENLLSQKPIDRAPIPSASGGVITVEVLTDPLDHERLADSDSEIVDRAAFLRDLTTVPVYIATWDNLMRFRASVADVQVADMLPEYEEQD
jgi:hypothetical protein